MGYSTGIKNDTGASKDKYKTLARRLKEERNQYRETCEEKQKEQEELKVEMEKMSELIGELRENCQKLQTELLDSRNNLQAQQEQSTKQQNKPQSQQRDTSNVGVQVTLLTESSNRPSNTTGRRTSSSSITSESVKKARQVYCAKQPKPRYYSAGVTLNSSHATTGNQIKPNQNSSNSSSMTSLRCGSIGGDQEGDEANVTQPASKKESTNNNENSN